MVIDASFSNDPLLKNTNMFTQEQIEKIKAGCGHRTPIGEAVSVASGKTYLEFVDEQVEKRWPFKGVSYSDVFGMDHSAIIKACQESAEISFSVNRGGYVHELFNVEESMRDVNMQYLTSYLNERFPATKGYTYKMFCTWRDKEREKVGDVISDVWNELFGPESERAKTSDE